MGYHRAGFDVVGVDINPQPNYPFEFVQADAVAWSDFAGFDVIHASPPCQSYSTMTNRYGSRAPALIGVMRAKLKASGLPYVIENVMGAKSLMDYPVMFCGRAVGAGLHRHRLFESSEMMLSAGCSRPDNDDAAVYGKDDGRRLWTRADGSELRVASYEKACAAMGIDWMEWRELCEAIPPAMTETIALAFL